MAENAVESVAAGVLGRKAGEGGIGNDIKLPLGYFRFDSRKKNELVIHIYNIDSIIPISQLSTSEVSSMSGIGWPGYYVAMPVIHRLFFLVCSGVACIVYKTPDLAIFWG